MKHRLIAEQSQADRDGQRVGEHQRNEGTRLKLEQQKFNGQQRSGNRSVEHRGQAGARAAGQQNFALRRRRRNQLADERTERSAGLNNRPLGAERPAGANSDGRRNRLEDRDFGFDAALGREHRFHRLGDAVAL